MSTISKIAFTIRLLNISFKAFKTRHFIEWQYRFGQIFLMYLLYSSISFLLVPVNGFVPIILRYLKY